MFFTGIDTEATADPDLFGLEDPAFGMGQDIVPLIFEFIGEPKIVRVQKGDPIPFGVMQAPVSCGTDPLTILMEIVDLRKIILTKPCRVVRRAVVDDDRFQGLEVLLTDGEEGLLKKGGAIVGRNDDTNGG